MYSIGIVLTVLIGGLIATVASNDDSLLCYLQKLDGKLDNIESKLDTLQKKATTSGNGDSKPKHNGDSKPKRTRDPSTIGSSLKKKITGFTDAWNIFITDGGLVYLPDFDSGKLYTLDSDGNKLKDVSFPGQPASIYVLRDEVYVADFKYGKIRRYTKDLVPVSSKDFDSPTPASLAVDSNGNIYVVGYSNNKVKIYKDDGSKSGEIEFEISDSNKYLRTIRFDAKENLFGSSYYESSILVYTKAGTLVNKFTISGITYTVGPFIDDIGNIYVADHYGMIYILNSSGAVIKSFQSVSKYICDIALAPDGTLWILDNYGAIYLY